MRRSAVLVLITLVACLLPLATPTPALAATAGDIYVVDPSCCLGGGVLRVNPATHSQALVTYGGNTNAPFGIAVAADSIYVINEDCCSGNLGGVVRLDPTTGDQTIVSSGGLFVNPSRIALAPDGTLYIVDQSCCAGGHGGVIRVDPRLPDGSNQTLISAGGSLAGPFGIAVTPDGTLYVADFACCTGGNGGIFRIDAAHPGATGANQTLISAGGSFVDPSDVTVADDGTLYVVDFSCCPGGKGGVIRVDPTHPSGTGANQTIVSSAGNLVEPVGLALAADGALYVADQFCCANGHGGIIRVDPTLPNGSNQTLVIDAFGGSPGGDTAVAVVPGVSIADTTVTEGNSGSTQASFTLTLAPRQTQRITIPYAVTDGTATAGADYVAAAGTVTFDPGQTTATVSVQVTGDLIAEPAETFRVTLTPPAGIGAVRSTATGTILDDDSPTTISLGDATVTEGDSGMTVATFTATLSPASGQVVSAQYITGDGSATAPGDYTSTSGTITFQPGETTRQISVQVVGDTSVEQDETFTVTLSNPSSGAALGRAQATGLIRNDDGLPAITIGDTTVTEGNSGTTTLSFPVSLSLPSSHVITMQYSTSDGSAQAPGDYVAASSTLTFQPGETSKTIDVQIVGDITPEPDETFTITLSNPSSGATLGRAQATGLIRNDDAALTPQACSPLPRVQTSPAVSGGKLLVHVEATPRNTQQNNPLQSVRFDQLDNARVTLNGKVVSEGQTINLPANTIAVDFTVERVTPGQATTVRLTVVDSCGSWSTFVGGGTAAGF